MAQDIAGNIKELASQVEEQDMFISEMLANVNTHLRLALNSEIVNSDTVLSMDARKLYENFIQLQELIEEHIIARRRLVFPLLKVPAALPPDEISRAQLMRELDKMMLHDKELMERTVWIDNMVNHLWNISVNSPSLHTSCSKWSALSLKIHQQLAVTSNELFPAAMQVLEEKDRNNFYITNTQRIMKNILVPVDYTNTSANATRYAVQVAKLTGATITLLHLYQVPVPPSEVPVVLIPAEELFEENMQVIQEHAAKLRSEFPGINFTCRVKADGIATGVAESGEDYEADLIVMGISGKEDLEHYVFGHNAVGVVNNTRVPLLIVPESTVFGGLRKAVLAFDSEEVKHRRTFDALRRLSEASGMEVMVVHVLESEDELPTTQEAIAGLKLEHALEGIKHTLHYPVGRDVISTVNHVALKEHADLVVMVHHPRGLVRRLFTTQYTKDMTLSSSMPLLVLPG